MNKSLIFKIESYVEAFYPIIYINHFDFKVIDDVIKDVAKSRVEVLEFNNGLGAIDFDNKTPLFDCDLEHFLKNVIENGLDKETFIILKDIHKQLENDKIIALLKRIAENYLYSNHYNATIFLISSILRIPPELENLITVIDFPLPSLDEIHEIINDYKDSLKIAINQEEIDEIALSFRGMNEFQIRQTLNLAYHDGGSIDPSDKRLILQEKEQIVKKMGMLELVNFNETIDQIGGLENLKEWLNQKEYVFKHLDKAIKFGVDIPKGMLIVGMPGCGKSLTAKATANMFGLPLVRLDVGRLLGKYVGESEQNMRKALKLAEAISPCVLWIDEIEKAFAGIGHSNGGDNVTTRLFGQFLTWMQEKENTVFIVATANNIATLPPEFLRKGRFDEIFFVDLPNDEERRKIIEIHLKKRNKWKLNQWDSGMQLKALIDKTKGYSGADLEALINNTLERAFIDDRKTITVDDLLKETKDSKCIKDLLGEAPPKKSAPLSTLDIMRDRDMIIKYGIRPASKSQN